MKLISPDQREGALVFVLRPRLEPKDVRSLIESLAHLHASATPLLVSPYLSENTRTRLREGNIGFLDLTGNVRIALTEPGLFIETQGASRDPNREERPARSLRGMKAGCLARALIELRKPLGVRELAALTQVDAGYVSRVLSFLDSEAIVTRGKRGRIESIDWPALLRRWAEDAPLDSRGIIRTFLEPRGISKLQGRLMNFEGTYAITGSLAAVSMAPLAPARLAMLWVPDVESAVSELGLRPVDVGANVMLLESGDEQVFQGAIQHEGIWYAAPTQVALDLLTSPGRGPQEGEELIEWMKKNEDKWRR